MKVTVQVVTHSDDGQETIREVACVERADLTPTTLGLSLAESIARTHGASIEVRRTESASTVFRVVFSSRDARPSSPTTIDAAQWQPAEAAEKHD